MHTRSTAYKIFSAFNYAILGCLALISLIPVIHILAISFSSRAPAEAHLVALLPIGFTFESYLETLENSQFARALWNGVVRTLLGTFVSLVVLVPAAYALSKPNSEFRGRTIYMWIFLFALMFSGGLIPTYIVVRNLGMINSIWALVLPGAVNVWNMILLMNFFRTSVPKALEEAALLDGASQFKILTKIYLPISIPAIATISLFTVVFHWNSWFDGLIYMTDTSNYPLATFLQTLLVQQDMTMISTMEGLANLTNRTVKAAQIFIALIPVLLIYPYLQQFFVKGIVLGAVKE